MYVYLYVISYAVTIAFESKVQNGMICLTLWKQVSVTLKHLKSAVDKPGEKKQ